MSKAFQASLMVETIARLPSRRQMLAGSGFATIAAAISLPAVVPPQTAGVEPDAELLRICADHVVNLHAYNDNPIDADEDPLWDAYERTRDAISNAKPQTLAGMQAKARAAKAEALTSRTDGTEMPEGTPAERWAWDLVNDLLALRAVA